VPPPSAGILPSLPPSSLSSRSNFNSSPCWLHFKIHQKIQIPEGKKETGALTNFHDSCLALSGIRRRIVTGKQEEAGEKLLLG
jgi:hypothetical protein